MAQRPHLDLDNYLPYLINRVGTAMAATYTADALAPQGLSSTCGACWRRCRTTASSGRSTSSAMTSIDASTMSRLVTRMVRHGLVTRTRSKTSNREVVVALSPKGRAQVESLIPIAKSLEGVASGGSPQRSRRWSSAR